MDVTQQGEETDILTIIMIISKLCHQFKILIKISITILKTVKYVIVDHMGSSVLTPLTLVATNISPMLALQRADPMKLMQRENEMQKIVPQHSATSMLPWQQHQQECWQQPWHISEA